MLAENIKWARKSAGLSQSELARIVGVSVNTISGIELGRIKPSVDTFIRIARACNVSLDILARNYNAGIEESTSLGKRNRSS
ncbi:MAG: antitoxin HipB [Pelotomaculum sp. PtaB.Bin104]|nr:MAG: antitoxin HipB [Pelotomaculum sp. PtaB.Bin104]